MLKESFHGNERMNPLVVLNNVEISCEYITKLRTDLEIMCQQLFSERPKELENIKSCLDEFKNTSKIFKEDLLMVSASCFEAHRNSRNTWKKWWQGSCQG
jgi:hypothetical protein